MTTARNLYLKDFRKYIRQADMEDILTDDAEIPLTVFGPQNSAFNGLIEDIEWVGMSLQSTLSYFDT